MARSGTKARTHEKGLSAPQQGQRSTRTHTHTNSHRAFSQQNMRSRGRWERAADRNAGREKLEAEGRAGLCVQAGAVLRGGAGGAHRPFRAPAAATTRLDVRR